MFTSFAHVARTIDRCRMIAGIATLIFCIVVWYLIRDIIKPKNFPPGPKWYPIIGCNKYLQRKTRELGSQWKALSHIAKEYSTQVLGLKLGSELVVIVYGKRNIRRVLTEKEFEGRPDNFFIRLRCFGKRMGITFTDGPLWREHRKFTVKHLKNVGFGKTLMEKEIQKEMANIVRFIKENGHGISPKTILAPAVTNVLWKYTAGETVPEERLRYFLNLMSARSKAFNMTGGWLNQWPWLRFIFPEVSGYSLIAKINEELSNIIEDSIHKHQKREIPGEDFIYSFLKEVENEKETYTEEQLKLICLDLLIAGSQSTSNVVEFAILRVLRNKIIQEKIIEEIDSIIGDEIPCWTDSHKLIYTSAFLLEVQRYYTIAPLIGPRRVLSDAVIDGYNIPKNSSVLASTGDLHFDVELWDKPNEFKPERFIDESGNLKIPEYMYHFGFGRRRCPGDSLAKSFIFIVFVGILQKYRIQCTNGILPTIEPVIGLIASPVPYTADFINRK